MKRMTMLMIAAAAFGCNMQRSTRDGAAKTVERVPAYTIERAVQSVKTKDGFDLSFDAVIMWSHQRSSGAVRSRVPVDTEQVEAVLVDAMAENLGPVVADYSSRQVLDIHAPDPTIKKIESRMLTQLQRSAANADLRIDVQKFVIRPFDLVDGAVTEEAFRHEIETREREAWRGSGDR